jgi:hypothetical protein
MGDRLMTKETPSQADRFREAARALECDDDAAHFDAKLKKVAKAAKPKGEKSADPA